MHTKEAREDSVVGGWRAQPQEPPAAGRCSAEWAGFISHVQLIFQTGKEFWGPSEWLVFFTQTWELARPGPLISSSLNRAPLCWSLLSWRRERGLEEDPHRCLPLGYVSLLRREANSWKGKRVEMCAAQGRCGEPYQRYPKRTAWLYEQWQKAGASLPLPQFIS
jgi:hypothetical protein